MMGSSSGRSLTSPESARKPWLAGHLLSSPQVPFVLLSASEARHSGSQAGPGTRGSASNSSWELGTSSCWGPGWVCRVCPLLPSDGHGGFGVDGGKQTFANRGLVSGWSDSHPTGLSMYLL